MQKLKQNQINCLISKNNELKSKFYEQIKGILEEVKPLILDKNKKLKIKTKCIETQTKH